jgi:4-hydroxy-3-methylbut-2-enyl diphosphate reductase IspH
LHNRAVFTPGQAIDIAQSALSKYGAPVYVRHEIVHNRHVVESLRSRGAIFVNELSIESRPPAQLRDAEASASVSAN